MSSELVEGLASNRGDITKCVHGEEGQGLAVAVPENDLCVDTHSTLVVILQRSIEALTALCLYI